MCATPVRLCRLAWPRIWRFALFWLCAFGRQSTKLRCLCSWLCVTHSFAILANWYCPLLVLGLWKKVALNFSSVECFVGWWVMKIPLQRGPSLEWCNQSVEQQVFSTPNLIQFCLLLIFEFRAANYLKWYVSDTSLLIFRKKMLWNNLNPFHNRPVTSKSKTSMVRVHFLLSLPISYAE